MSYKDDLYPPLVDADPVASNRAGRLFARLALFAGGLLLCVILIWPQQAAIFNQEGGLIETLSAAALFTAGLVALVRYRGISRAYIGLVCLLLAERELEADVYAEGSLPFVLLHGLDVLLDMTAVRVLLGLVIVGGAVWHGIPSAWRALKQRALFLLVFVLAGAAAVVAQLLEEVSGFLDVGVSSLMATRLFVLEETLEMYFSVGILAAVLIGWPRSKTKEMPNDLDRKPDTR